MKRSFLYTALVLGTMVIATGSRTFGDSKNRIGSGGFNRNNQNNHQNNNHQNNNHQNNNKHNGGQNFGSLSGRFGNLSGGHGHGNGNSGNGGTGNGNSGGNKMSGGSHQQHHGIKLSHLGNNGNHQNQIGQSRHTIQLPNGTKTNSIAINVGQLLKHTGHSKHVQPQIHNIVASAPKHLCGQPHFSWWVDVCHNHCHTNYGGWNVNNQYWDCWTPCNWQVVRCEQFSYYIGLNCTYIPDMQAYGVQSVNDGSPAQFAGLQTGDLIVTVNGQSVFDAKLVNSELVRGRLDLQVLRQGAPAPIFLTVLPRVVQTVSF